MKRVLLLVAVVVPVLAAAVYSRQQPISTTSTEAIGTLKIATAEKNPWTGLKLNNERSLTAAADGVSKQLASITEKYDGSTMAGLDSLIPGPDKYKGTARKAGAIN